MELCRGFETKFCENLDGSEVRERERRGKGRGTWEGESN